jgi:hypothetical protein
MFDSKSHDQSPVLFGTVADSISFISYAAFYRPRGAILTIYVRKMRFEGHGCNIGKKDDNCSLKTFEPDTDSTIDTQAGLRLRGKCHFLKADAATRAEACRRYSQPHSAYTSGFPLEGFCSGIPASKFPANTPQRARLVQITYGHSVNTIFACGQRRPPAVPQQLFFIKLPSRVNPNRIRSCQLSHPTFYRKS